MPDELTAFRMLAALRSEGTSSSTIKKMVLGMVKRERVGGKVLDFGAGKGELISLMSKMSGLQMYGADIVPRPASIPVNVEWYQTDLNNKLNCDQKFDCVICSEVIEHLENPRSTFRNIRDLLKPGGKLLLTMPNQENIRSYLNLIFRGHFASFKGDEYPAHITALLRIDLIRICSETGFSMPQFQFVDYGWMPLTRTTWQRFSFDLLKGRLFSDTVGMIATKLSV